jgi:hypothetical protein
MSPWLTRLPARAQLCRGRPTMHQVCGRRCERRRRRRRQSAGSPVTAPTPPWQRQPCAPRPPAGMVAASATHTPGHAHGIVAVVQSAPPATAGSGAASATPSTGGTAGAAAALQELGMAGLLGDAVGATAGNGRAIDLLFDDCLEVGCLGQRCADWRAWLSAAPHGACAPPLRRLRPPPPLVPPLRAGPRAGAQACEPLILSATRHLRPKDTGNTTGASVGDKSMLLPPSFEYVSNPWHKCDPDERGALCCVTASAAALVLDARSSADVENVISTYGEVLVGQTFDDDATPCARCGAAIGFIYFQVRHVGGRGGASTGCMGNGGGRWVRGTAIRKAPPPPDCCAPHAHTRTPTTYTTAHSTSQLDQQESHHTSLRRQGAVQSTC